MSKADSMHRKDKKCINSESENMRGRDHFGDIGTDKRIILKWILKN
jgi:hypothetical protein